MRPRRVSRRSAPGLVWTPLTSAAKPVVDTDTLRTLPKHYVYPSLCAAILISRACTPTLRYK